MKYRRYTKDMKRFVFTARHHRGESVANIITAVRERFGVDMPENTVRYIVCSECKRAGVRSRNQFHSKETRNVVLSMARSGKYRTAGEIIKQLNRQMEGRIPSNTTINIWIKRAGLSFGSMSPAGGAPGHPSEVREMTLSLYDQGLPIAEVCRLVNEAHVTRITCHAVYRWLKQAGRPANRKPGPHPGTSHDKVGRRYHMHVHYMLPQGAPQWIRDQVVMSSAFGSDIGLEATAKQCEDMASEAPLWWSRKQSTNPRWTKKRTRSKPGRAKSINAAPGRRMAA